MANTGLVEDRNLSPQEQRYLSWLQALDLTRLDIQINRTAQNATELKAGTSRQDVDVWIIPSASLRRDDVTDVLCEQYPGTSLKPVVALCSATQEDIGLALSEGIAGIVLSNDSPWTFSAAVHAAHERMLFISPSVLTCHRDQVIGVVTTSARKHLDDLTSREHEVLMYATQGYSNSKIAKKLFIAPTTVGSHMLNILRKLQVSNRTEAAAIVLQAELPPGRVQS